MSNSIIPNILTFKGCFLSQCETVEDVFDRRLVAEAAERDEGSYGVVYDTIPKKFYDLERWPKSTNLACWWCDLIPRGVPLFVPLELHMDGSMLAEGNFCSWKCAWTYASREHRGDKLWGVYEMLRRLHKIIEKRQIEWFSAAPPRTVMKRWGGNLDENEYIKLLESN